jgi:hypothetical protein
MAAVAVYGAGELGEGVAFIATHSWMCSRMRTSSTNGACALKIFSRPSDLNCINSEAVTRSNKALFEATEIGDFVTVGTDLGEIRTRIFSIVDGNYVGKVLECPDVRYVGAAVKFEEMHMLVRESPIAEL